MAELINISNRSRDKLDNLEIGTVTVGTEASATSTKKKKDSGEVVAILDITMPKGEGGGGTSEETDPTVPQHVKNITVDEIIKWNSVKVSEGNTTFWNDFNKTYIPMKNEIVIYTDYFVDNDKLIPNIKIGDGNVPVIDLPFINQKSLEEMMTHIQDSTIHVTPSDRLKWDNKISCDINESEENIIFYT